MTALAPSARSAQVDDLRALDGEWLYVEDRTEGRASEDQQPPMSVTFALREVVRLSDNALLTLIRREFRVTPDGLLVHVVVGDPAQLDSVALYRHPQDIALRAPAQATMADMAWLAGAWNGKLVVDRGALEPAAGRRDARRVAHGQGRLDGRL